MRYRSWLGTGALMLTLVGAFGAGASPSWGDDGEDWYKAFIASLQHARIAELSAALDSAEFARRLPDRIAAGTISRDVLNFEHILSLREPDEAETFLALLESKLRAHRDSLEDPTTYVGPVEQATVALCRCRQRLGLVKAPQPGWDEAAAVWLGSYEKTPALTMDGLLGAQTMLWAARDPGRPVPSDHLARARKVFAAIGSTETEEQMEAVAGLARTHLLEAQVKSKRKAKKALLAAAAVVAPFRKGKETPGPIADVVVECVVMDRARSLKAKIAPLEQDFETVDSKLRFTVPAIARWVRSAKIETGDIRLALQRRCAIGVNRHEVVVSLHDSSRMITGIRGQRVSLNDMRALAQHAEEANQRVGNIEDVTKRLSPKKFEVNKKQFGTGWTAGVEGRAANGTWARIQSYWFRAKRQALTCNFMVISYEREPVLPDVIRQILESAMPIEK